MYTFLGTCVQREKYLYFQLREAGLKNAVNLKLGFSQTGRNIDTQVGSEDVLKPCVGKSWHMFLSQDTGAFRARAPFIGIKVICSERVLQTDMPGEHSSLDGMALLQPEVKPTICRCSHSVDH